MKIQSMLNQIKYLNKNLIHFGMSLLSKIYLFKSLYFLNNNNNREKEQTSTSSNQSSIINETRIFEENYEILG